MTRRYLTTANPKLDKCTRKGYLAAGLFLAPADLAGTGHDLCPNRTPQCTALCLNTAGRGQMTTTQNARIRKTHEALAMGLRSFATIHLVHEIAAHERAAKKISMRPLVRLNGTTDIPWERVTMPGGYNLMQLFSRVTFADYTKHPTRVLTNTQTNYHLILSRSENNETTCLEHLKLGHRVAIVFSTPKGKRLPRHWYGFPVHDGDLHDAHFLWPKASVIGLRAKGRAKTTTTRSYLEQGFVVHPNCEACR